MKLLRLLPAVLASLVLVCPVARAEAPKDFAEARDRAKPLDGLTAFLDRYIGNCDDPFEKSTCQGNVKKARGEMDGKSYYLILDDGASKMLRPGGYNPNTQEFRFDLTPFFDGGGRALTHGAPNGQDAEGRVRLPIIPLFAKLPLDWMPMDMERLLRTGNVKLQIIFKPQGVWMLKGKDGRTTQEGVKAKFLGVRLTHARNGTDLAYKMNP